MTEPWCTLTIVSDIHYAGPQEQRRRGHELAVVPNPLLRWLVKLYRHLIWLRDPFAHNHLLGDFIRSFSPGDWLIANGDYSCDTAFVGVSDDAAFDSAATCLQRLRQTAGDRFRANIGDHELGKTSLLGGVGGLRLASWNRCTQELGLVPLWRLDLGRYSLLGVTSSLLDLPVFEPETLPTEQSEWRRLRDQHLRDINAELASIPPSQRLILFTHDPTALPFLWTETDLPRWQAKIECTWIGHLHTPLVLLKARALAGMPTVRCLGNSVRRMSEALQRARMWQPFRVRLCPSLAGVQLTQRGGFFRMRLDDQGNEPPAISFHHLPWHC